MDKRQLSIQDRWREDAKYAKQQAKNKKPKKIDKPSFVVDWSGVDRVILKENNNDLNDKK